MTTSAGWHPDPNGRHELRYHDGTRWTEHVSDHGEQAAHVESSQRAQILERQGVALLAEGAQILTRTPTEIVFTTGSRPNHLLHFFVGLFTLGLWWIFGWIPIAIFGGVRRYVMTVDDAGRVTRRRA